MTTYLIAADLLNFANIQDHFYSFEWAKGAPFFQKLHENSGLKIKSGCNAIGLENCYESNNRNLNCSTRFARSASR